MEWSKKPSHATVPLIGNREKCSGKDASVQYLNNRSHGQKLSSTPGQAELLGRYFFKGTVRPDWICMRVVSLKSPLKAHKPL